MNVQKRIPIDSHIAAEIQFSSDRTCCVCRVPRKAMHIHHLDDDPSNGVIANLCLLCTDCHSQTQMTGGFSRKLDRATVTRYRDDWLEEVSRRRRITPTVDSLSAIHEDLVRFLGDDVRAERVRLVYPVFGFSAEASKRLNDLRPDALYDKKFLRQMGRGTGLLQPLAANDIRALGKVAGVLTAGGVEFELVSDEDVERIGGHFPVVAFGLASNNMVSLYYSLCRSREDSPLFDCIPRDDAEPGVTLPNGVHYLYDPDRYGLIARTTPHADHPGRKWIFVAGIGPTGTEGAATYFADSWHILAQRVAERDFVALVTCDERRASAASAAAGDIMFKDGRGATLSSPTP